LNYDIDILIGNELVVRPIAVEISEGADAKAHEPGRKNSYPRANRRRDHHVSPSAASVKESVAVKVISSTYKDGIMISWKIQNANVSSPVYNNVSSLRIRLGRQKK
jgi:hypothetical protein